MNILTKVILVVLSSLCLFFLVYFTFFGSNNNQIINTYNYLEKGDYTIQSNYEIIPGLLGNGEKLQFKNISIGNNIFYKSGDIRIDENTIELSPGIYYFDINSLDFNYKIMLEGSETKIIGPGSFVINNEKIDRKNRILSLSAKLELQLTFQSDRIDESEYKPALLNLYPNMFLSYNPRSNINVNNGDLLRVGQVHSLFMFEGDIYSSIQNDDGTQDYQLNQLLKDGFFNQNPDKYLFFKEIYDYKKYRSQNLKRYFNLLKEDSFYNLPGEKYILNYYSYFVNEEKKKTYFKNLILKDLISLTNSNSGNFNNSNILTKLSDLQKINQDEYNKMLQVINHYYENIIISQHNNQNLIMNISQLIFEIENIQYTFKNPSIINLHSIYENYHYGDKRNYYVLLNSFIESHEKEMGISIYDENNKIHGYFLFFLKNILSTNIENFDNIEDLIIILERYLNIVNIYAEKGTPITQKTILFDNIEILKVFINILELSFIDEERNDKGLITLKRPALLGEGEYILLKNNLETIINIFDTYKRLIENSRAEKDILMYQDYIKINEKFDQYILAIDDYSGYEIKYGFTSIVVPIDIGTISEEDYLSLEKITNYLKKFGGVKSLTTEISIRDYPYCIQPDFISEVKSIKIEEGYCYEVKNLFINGYSFSFILTPSQGNTLSYLTYIDDKNTLIEKEKFIIFELDELEESLQQRFESSQLSEKYKYDFSRFFINRFIQSDMDIDDNPLFKDNTPDFRIPDGKGIQSVGANRIKSELLQSGNSPLVQIRDVILITFNDLVFTSDSGVDKLEVYPSDFKLLIQGDNSSNNFSGKFEAEYSFESTPHTFTNGKIYIKNNVQSFTNKYLLDGNPINIIPSFNVIDSQGVLTQTLFDFTKIEFIYEEIMKKYGSTDNNIKISHNRLNQSTIFTIGNNMEIIFSKNGNISILQSGNEINEGFYRNITIYLNNL